MPDEIYLNSGSINVTYSNVQGGWEGEGNISTNPVFADAENGDYKLSNYSPCIGTATSTGSPTNDIMGNPRPNPSGSNPDMGAYENALAINIHNYLIHVDTSGNDSFGNGLSHNPFASIQTAINNAVDGDTVLVNPGTYIENINFNGKNIVVGSLFITTQDTSYISTTVIDGSKDVVGNGGTVVCFVSSETNNAKLIGFTLSNGTGYRLGNEPDNDGTYHYGGGVYCYNSNPTLLNLKIINNNVNSAGGGIALNKSNPLISNIIIDDNIASEKGAGIYSYWSNPNIKNVLITNNSNLYGPSGSVLYAAGGSNVSITHLTSFGNNSLAIFGEAGEIINIKNSILWDDGVPIIEWDESQCSITYSAIKLGFVSGSEGNIASDPLFVDSLNGNFKLSPYSPCIGAGTIDNSLIFDLNGNLRPDPFGTKPDMGAYENDLGFTKMLFDSTICAMDTLKVKYGGNLSANMNLLWNFTGASFVDTITDKRNPKVIWDEEGYKSISLLIKENGITVDNQNDSVLVYAIPTPSFSINTQKLCGLDTIIITYNGTGTPDAAYNWSFGDGNIISGSGQGAYQVNWGTTGLKNISLSVTENGCTSDILSNNIRIYNPISSFALNEVVCEDKNTTLTFSGYATDSAIFNWDFNSANIVSGTRAGPYDLNWDNLGPKYISLSINDNGCSSLMTIDTIDHNPIPTPTITALSGNICFKGIANISYNGTASNDAEFNWDFSSGSIISGIDAGPYEISWDSSGEKLISLFVTEDGCSSEENINIIVNPQTQIIPICLVGVDSLNHNMVVWEQPMDILYDSIIIYKETSQSDLYEKIGSQSASDYSTFTDTLSNPSQNSSRYKLAILDTCGFESSPGDYHKTIHLTINAGINGAWNLIWDGYEGFDYNSYNIYRGTSDNNLLKIAEQASNTFTYTDLAPPEGTVFYQMEVQNPTACNVGSNQRRSGNYYSATRSNVVSPNRITGISDLVLEERIEVWPNPTKDRLYIRRSDIESIINEISILTIEGKVLINKQYDNRNMEIDISALKSGVYLMILKTKEKVIKRKVVKL